MSEVFLVLPKRLLVFNPDKLKKIRIDCQISQRVLADAIGVSHVAIHSWENGTKIPSMYSLGLLEQYFGDRLFSSGAVKEIGIVNDSD